MNPLDLAYINRLAPYKVWTENGRDYLVETGTHLLFRVGFMDRLADGNNKDGLFSNKGRLFSNNGRLLGEKNCHPPVTLVTL